MAFTPPKPGPMTRIKNEILDHLAEDGWLDFCKFVKGQNETMVLALTKTLLEVDLFLNPDQLTPRDIFWHITLALSSSPVVEYIVEKELADSLGTASLPDEEMTIEEAFRLPFQVVAIRIAGAAKTAYKLYAINDGDLLVSADDGHFAMEHLSSPMGSIYPRFKGTDSKGFRTQLGVLAYIVHGKDTQEDRIWNRGSSKKARNKVGTEVVRGVVGGRFAAAYRLWTKAQSDSRGGTHAGPRPHLRAGHWHLYWTGRGRTTPKMNFVHPCLVNADEVGDVEIQRTLQA